MILEENKAFNRMEVTFGRMKGLAITHEFGIIENFNKLQAYHHYTPNLYACITVKDNYMEEMLEPLAIMKTYFHTYERPAYGLAYSGITLIPPESLPIFLDIVLSNKKRSKSEQLANLAVKIKEAQKAKKYMIHFGV